MKHVHLILQGKGGVGKSLVASLLAQHYLARGIAPVCIDTDPVNQTFAGYEAFGAAQLKLMNGDDLDPRAFDQLVERVVAADDDAVFIIDNGAATFIPLCAWMIENEVVRFFRDAGVELILHSVLTGGQALSDTMVGLSKVLEHFDLSAVVWLNEYFGRPERNGMRFEQSALYQKHEGKIRALIKIPLRRKETFGADLDQILREKKSFKEAAGDPSLTIAARQRLALIWRDLDAQITAANLS